MDEHSTDNSPVAGVKNRFGHSQVITNVWSDHSHYENDDIDCNDNPD